MLSSDKNKNGLIFWQQIMYTIPIRGKLKALFQIWSCESLLCMWNMMLKTHLLCFHPQDSHLKLHQKLHVTHNQVFKRINHMQAVQGPRKILKLFTIAYNCFQRAIFALREPVLALILFLWEADWKDRNILLCCGNWFHLLRIVIFILPIKIPVYAFYSLTCIKFNFQQGNHKE